MTTERHNAEDSGAMEATEHAQRTTSNIVTFSSVAAKSPTRRKSDAEYIPDHLKPYVFHSQEDFYVSRSFNPSLLCHLMVEGFLPIASEYGGQCFLLPKLHRQRCLLLTKEPEHVPKSVKKRSKKYKLTLNKDFDGVVKGCHTQHGIPWLYPPMVAAFRTILEASTQGIEVFPGCRLRFYSVEMLDITTNELVAGEIGYTVGKVYTSLTGFSGQSGAGTVQLHALSKVLHLSGFELWDLGMSMPYKMSLGANDVDRDVFLTYLHQWREQDCLLQLDQTIGDLQTGAYIKTIFDAPPIIQNQSKQEENEDEFGA